MQQNAGIGTLLLVGIVYLCHGSMWHVEQLIIEQSKCFHYLTKYNLMSHVIRILKRSSSHKNSIKSKLNWHNYFIIVIHVQSFFFYPLWHTFKMAIPRESIVIYGCLLLGRNIIHIDYTFSQAPQQQSHFIRHLLIPGATSYLPSSLLLPIAMS